jgi:hypothetical protein
MTRQLAERVDTLVDADTTRLIQVFKDIHRHPELGFDETRTAGIVAETLTERGFAVTTGIGGTGVAAILHNGPGPTVMYRADMDGLAVEEATGLYYSSTVRVSGNGGESPVAHVCGHDAHVTWMLGMANVLGQTVDAWSGTAVLIAQPAEELIAGAQAMVDDGLYDVVPKPDSFVAMHTGARPGRHVGRLGRAEDGGYRPARHRVQRCRRPRVDAATDQGSRADGRVGRRRVPDDREPQRRAAGNRGADGRFGAGRLAQQRHPGYRDVESQPAVVQPAGA